MQRRRREKKEEIKQESAIFNQAIASAILLAAVILLSLINTDASVLLKEKISASISKNMTVEDFKNSAVEIVEKFDIFKKDIANNLNTNELLTESETGDRIDESVLDSLKQQEDDSQKKPVVPE